jgi:NAD(P)-dependent dehydrogenase (short-subunit alcohol dehydrogenase family)
VAFQVNYLAPYLLTTKLSSKLAGACGRVVNVSSVTRAEYPIIQRHQALKRERATRFHPVSAPSSLESSALASAGRARLPVTRAARATAATRASGGAALAAVASNTGGAAPIGNCRSDRSRRER